MLPWWPAAVVIAIETRQRNPKWKNPPLRIEMAECINCDACLRHCPTQFGAIFNHGPDVVIIPELCSGCDKCLPACPVELHLPVPGLGGGRVPGGVVGRAGGANDPYRLPSRPLDTRHDQGTAPGRRAVVRRWRTGRGTVHPRLHRQPELDAGGRPGRSPPPASPSSCPGCPATGPRRRHEDDGVGRLVGRSRRRTSAWPLGATRSS